MRGATSEGARSALAFVLLMAIVGLGVAAAPSSLVPIRTQSAMRDVHGHPIFDNLEPHIIKHNLTW